MQCVKFSTNAEENNCTYTVKRLKCITSLYANPLLVPHGGYCLISWNLFKCVAEPQRTAYCE